MGNIVTVTIPIRIETGDASVPRTASDPLAPDTIITMCLLIIVTGHFLLSIIYSNASKKAFQLSTA